MKRRSDFHHGKTNTIEHFGPQGKELKDIQGKRLYENYEAMDDESVSRGDHGNLLNNVDDFDKNFNGSNFDI